jgi:uncharacterized alkaline shock family protein YloU
VAVDDPDDALLDRAAETLRELTDSGWVRARDSVLDRVRRAVRPSAAVTGRHADGAFTLATPVLTDRIRRAVDAVTEARVLDLRPEVDADGELLGIALRISVAYGSSVAADAESARAAVVAEVRRSLGTEFEAERVTVDLHVADVHRG